MKPGNLRVLQGAKSGGETKDEAFDSVLFAPRNPGAFFLSQRIGQEKGTIQ